jgi:hypothetical protein
MEIKKLNVLTIEHVETNSGTNQVTLHVVDDMFGMHLITMHATMLRDAHYAANTAFEGSYMQEKMLYGSQEEL